MECLGKKKKRERTSSHFHCTGDPKLQDEITGKQRVSGEYFTFFLPPTKYRYPNSPEVFRTMYSHV